MRYIAAYAPFTNGLYAVRDSFENCVIGEPKPYHEANDEAGQRNAGTWGKPEEITLDFNAITGWLPGTYIPGQP